MFLLFGNNVLIPISLIQEIEKINLDKSAEDETKLIAYIRLFYVRHNRSILASTTEEYESVEERDARWNDLISLLTAQNKPCEHIWSIIEESTGQKMFCYKCEKREDFPA